MKTIGCCCFRKRLRGALVCAAGLLASIMLGVAVTPAWALDQGSTSVGVSLGSGRTLGQTYTVLGARLGYFIADGFEFAVAGEMWRGSDPDLYKISPEVRYIWFNLPRLKPYAGAFYSRAIYDGLPDRNTYGAKGGVYLPVSTNAHLAAGLVYERIEACSIAIYSDCSAVYPEFSFVVSF